MEETNKLLIHIISCIFDLLKKHFKLLLSMDPKNKGIYDNIKILIMKCLERYLTMNNPDKLMTRYVADCLSVLILGGVFYHWTSCIPDLINESMKSNLNLCYLVLRALADIDILIHYNRIEEESYTSPLIISNGERMQIKDKLINHNEIVIKYIIYIYNGIKNISDENNKNRFISAILDTVRCWANFKINILKQLELAKIVYFIMNNYFIEIPEKFSFLVMDCISKSDNAKIYQSIDTDKGETPEQLSEKIFKSINYEEKKGLDLLLEFLFPNLDFFKENDPSKLSENKRKLFISYLHILASIIENYIYLFFNFSEERSSKMLEYFKFFLKYKKRKISSLFVEGMGEMRNFINNFYRFSGLNDDQKSDFANYFMSIFFGVLENCAYRKLDLEKTSLLDKEILNNSLSLDKNSAYFNNSESKNSFEEYDTEFVEELMTIDDYRNIAGDVFYNIFFIFLENFGDNASAFFLEKKILPRIYDTDILNDPNYPLIVDVIFFAICSLSEIFDVLDNNELKSLSVILNVINNFLQMKIVVENSRILIDFMILIYKYHNFIAKEAELFFKVIKFLLNVSKIISNEKIEQSCYVILSTLCYEKSDKIQNDFKLIDEIFSLFNSKYEKYDYKKISPLKNIIGIVLSLLGIKRYDSKNDLSQEQLDFYKNITEKISLPINTGIKELLEKYENRIANNLNDKEQLISEINKSYIIQEQIINSLDDFNLQIKIHFVKQYLNKFLFLTEKILNIFYDNNIVMNHIYNFYKNISKTIGENFDENLENINKLFIDFFISDKGDKNYKCILILKDIYLSLIKSAEKNAQLYSIYNKYLLEKYYFIVENFMIKITKSDVKNPLIKEKLKTLCEFHSEIFPKLIIDSSDQKIIKLIEDLITFLIKCIELLKNLEKEIETNGEREIILLIKSFNEIFNNKSFINSNNPNFIQNYINNIVIALWNIIYFRQFNSISRSFLINFYIMALKYDVKNFCEIFKKLIENNKEIPYIKEIIEFFIIFKDDNKNIKEMIINIMENIKGTGDWKKFQFLFSLTVKEKIARKNNNFK